MFAKTTEIFQPKMTCCKSLFKRCDFVRTDSFLNRTCPTTEIDLFMNNNYAALVICSIACRHHHHQLPLLNIPPSYKDSLQNMSHGSLYVMTSGVGLCKTQRHQKLMWRARRHLRYCKCVFPILHY